jgi:hypothetical protein
VGVTVKLNLSHMELPLCSGASFQLQWNHFPRNVYCTNICCGAF